MTSVRGLRELAGPEAPARPDAFADEGGGIRAARSLAWTVGHATRTTAELAALLRAVDVHRVIDVRRFPSSRHNPQFARERLAVEFPALGLAYDWLGGALGGRRLSGAADQEPGWRNAAFRAYAAYMGSEAFRVALAELEAEIAAGQRLALMCAETLWWRCHRRLIADALVLDGVAVRHLMVRSPGQLHRPHPGLRRDPMGRLAYDGAVPVRRERRVTGCGARVRCRRRHTWRPAASRARHVEMLRRGVAAARGQGRWWDSRLAPMIASRIPQAGRGRSRSKGSRSIRSPPASAPRALRGLGRW